MPFFRYNIVWARSMGDSASSPKSSKRANDRGDAEQHGRKLRVLP